MYVHTHVYMYINTYTYTYTCIMTFEHLVPAPAQADASRCCTPDKNSRKSVPQHFCYAKPPYRGLSYFPEMHTGFFTARATIEHAHNFVFIMQSLCIEDFHTEKKIHTSFFAARATGTAFAVFGLKPAEILKPQYTSTFTMQLFFVVADFGLKPAEILKLECPSTFCGIHPRQSRLFENRCLFLQRKSRFLLRLRMALRAQPLARGLFRNGGDQTFHVIPIYTYVHIYIGIYIYCT